MFHTGNSLSQALTSMILKERIIVPLVLFFLCLGLAKVCYELYLILSAEGHGLMNPDLPSYLIVGRGILNGLHIYRDLFESKPPGILYLSAISQFFGGTFMMRLYQAINLFSIPFLLGLFARRYGAIACLCGAVFGGLLAIRAHESAWGLQTEIFGLLPVTLYVLSIQYKGRWQLVSSSVSIFLAVFFREPYILGIIAAAIITSQSLKEFFWKFIVPSSIAGGIFLFILLVTGSLPSYIGLYLPTMLSHRIVKEGFDPLYLRLMWDQRLWSSITQFSTMPLLGWLMGGLWLSTVLEENWKRSLLFIAALLGGALAIGELYVLFTVFHKASAYGIGWVQVLTDKDFLPITVAYIVGFGLYFTLLYFTRKKLFRILALLSILPILSLAIGLADYRKEYLVFLVPVMISVFLPVLKRYYITLGISVILALTAFLYHQGKPQENLWYIYHRNSGQLEQIMIACKFDRYFAADTTGFPFMKYSPIGPIFSINDHKPYLGETNPLFQETYKNIVEKSDLIIQSSVAPHNLPEDVLRNFTKKIPKCAVGKVVPYGFEIFYRL